MFLVSHDLNEIFESNSSVLVQIHDIKQIIDSLVVQLIASCLEQSCKLLTIQYPGALLVSSHEDLVPLVFQVLGNILYSPLGIASRFSMFVFQAVSANCCGAGNVLETGPHHLLASPRLANNFKISSDFFRIQFTSSWDAERILAPCLVRCRDRIRSLKLKAGPRTRGRKCSGEAVGLCLCSLPCTLHTSRSLELLTRADSPLH
mmetsp:Transcript_40850/g.63766  ORF Transcript_40850/g.63766 Transcript_40850/m.63766 type:complete len:204 (+) Transcript_40850:678-1289(+)